MNVGQYAVSTKQSYKQAHLHVQEPSYFFFFIKNDVLPLIHVIY